jgi:hypothetical protein
MLEYMNKVKVVSRLELFVKAREAIQHHGGLTDDETKSVIGQYDLRPDQLVVISIIGDTPYMMGCPFLHEETIFKNKLFYHSHTFSPSETDYESALSRLRSMRLNQTTNMVNELFSKAGYRKTVADQKTGITTYRKKDGSEFSGIILLSINDVPQLLDNQPAGTVFVVPTEDTPAPFISFYRSQRTKVAEKRFSIIVVNVEDLKISPFLGYPSDKDIISQFTEPDLAVRIRTIWTDGEDEEQMF